MTGDVRTAVVRQELLARARAAGAKVIHVVHDGGRGSPYDLAAETGQIHPAVASLADKPVVVKTAPNAIFNTDLGKRLDVVGNKQVIVIWFMTHMCVTFTADGAFPAWQSADRRGGRLRDAADPHRRCVCASRDAARGRTGDDCRPLRGRGALGRVVEIRRNAAGHRQAPAAGHCAAALRITPSQAPRRCLPVAERSAARPRG
ncbi:TPA: isochorismatase family protein [Pseudomonas aeruginosa]|nr:isochorismatase family protein [Pseudomonas aeruginosa]UFK75219.1 isochorismatase family protein [Pseudomonas aeruginosa SG17M]EKU0635721.1 isochorismatase family protein [Pseudomonas aeruginosa]EKV3060182.1 isochorismatase family protein [Pseudomonas aeruginosa]EKV4733137.1 isochorismatase family protein [Pseudomonas aeruginosa]